MRKTLLRQQGPLFLSAALITAMAAAGCRSDERLVELSRESMNRQAEQNAQMARQSEAVTKTTEELIQSESNVQHDANQLNTQLHSERSTLDLQRQDLEYEHRSLASQRQREPIIAEAIGAAAALVVAALPLVVCWYLVRSLFFSTTDESTAAEILVEQLATQGPLLTACAETKRVAGDQSTNLFLSGQKRLPRHAKSDISAEQHSALRAVVVVEGSHDVEFLKRISRMLSQTNTSLPDLSQLETAGVIAFVVNNGASIAFPASVAANGPLEFHLLDQETGPTAVQREAAVLAISARPNCRATLTTKRAIENYLHPAAVREAGGIEIEFGDFDDVAEIVAKATVNQNERRSWESLSRRARRRLRDKAKKWLNRDAVDRMMPERLAERDPQGEVIGWLRTIGELATVPVDAPV